MILTAILIFAAMAWLGWAESYDVRHTIAGVAAGIADESFTLFVGPKPKSALKLYLRDLIYILPFGVAPAFFVAISGTHATLPLLVCPGLLGIHHFQGGRNWVKLTAMTPAQRQAWFNRGTTAWQKFLGQ